MADRHEFNAAVERVARERKEEMGQFIARLKKLTPDEFLRLPRKDLERLTMSQYADVAAAISPGLDVRPPPRELILPPAPNRRKPWSIRKRSAAAVTASVLLAAGIAFGGPTALAVSERADLVRPIYIGNWPQCTRLSETVDGCLYMPTQDLNWDYVAQMLGMSRADLLALNHHLPSTHAPAREKLIVWRRIGRLEN